MSELQYKHAGPANHELPKINIPDDCWTESGFFEFVIKTNAGIIKVTNGYEGALFQGTTDALSAYGLFRREWAPDSANLTNKTRQTVLFTDVGPALVVGRFDKGKNREFWPYLTIIRSGTRYSVAIPLTSEQEQLHQKKWEAWREAWRESDGQKPCKACHQEPRDSAGLDYQVGIRDANAEYVSKLLDHMRENITPSERGLTYSAESEARILRVTDELRRAYAEARMIPIAPKYRAEGNVIGWPGRGSVAAVAPAC